MQYLYSIQKCIGRGGKVSLVTSKRHRRVSSKTEPVLISDRGNTPVETRTSKHLENCNSCISKKNALKKFRKEIAQIEKDECTIATHTCHNELRNEKSKRSVVNANSICTLGEWVAASPTISWHRTARLSSTLSRSRSHVTKSTDSSLS